MADGPDTRTKILATAFRLFHEQGYHATSVATILREAGINSGSLYHFFASKEQLLVAVLEWALTELRPQVMDAVEAKTEDGIERVFALLDQYRDGMKLMGCRMGCPIGNLALEVADDHPEARTLIHKNFANWSTIVQGWLDSAGDRLPPTCNREQLARMILTVMEGGIMQARAAGNLQPFDDSVAQLRSYFEALQRQARLNRTLSGDTRASDERVAARQQGTFSAEGHMNFDLIKLNWLAVGVVCVATFLLGGIWYTLLGPLWIKYNNYTPEQVAEMKKLRPPPVFFGGMIVSYFVFAVFLAIVLRNMAIPSWSAGALAGLAIWLAIAVPIGVTSWIASNKQFGVYAIDLAYQFIFIIGASIIFAAWR